LCTHAVCEWAALASWSLRGIASHSRWCCSWPLGRESPYYPSSLHTPAGQKWPSGDGVPTAAIKKVTYASVNISIHKILIMLNHKESLTGIVHPQMKISSFINPQVVSSLYEVLGETRLCKKILPHVGLFGCFFFFLLLHKLNSQNLLFNLLSSFTKKIIQK